MLKSKYWDRVTPVGSIGVSVDNIVEEQIQHLDLFRDWDRERRLANTVDYIKDCFGTTALVRASSLTKAGRAFDRAGKIGGHYK